MEIKKMSMPRYLKEKYKYALKSKYELYSDYVFMLIMGDIGSNISESNDYSMYNLEKYCFKIMHSMPLRWWHDKDNVFTERYIDKSNITSTIYQRRLSYYKELLEDYKLDIISEKEFFFKKNNINRPEFLFEFEKVEVKYHSEVAKNAQDGNYTAFYVNLEVNNYFYEKAEELDEQKRIYKLKNYIYASRTFPQKLKVIIFEKDNYTCQICGKHKDHLEKDNHLEVDHITEWSDGGETSYKNGQTLCHKCNKGKHHAKKHKEKLKQVL